MQIIDVRDLASGIRCCETQTYGVFNATGPADALHGQGDARRDPARRLGRRRRSFTCRRRSCARNSPPVRRLVGSPGVDAAQGELAGFTQRSIAQGRGEGSHIPSVQRYGAARRSRSTTSRPRNGRRSCAPGFAADREATVLAAWKARPAGY